MATTITSGVQYSGIWTLQQAHDAISASTWPPAYDPGYLFTWGDNDIADGKLGLNVSGATHNKSSPVQVGSSSEWRDVNISGRTAHAIKSNGTLWAWGFNDQSKIGDGTEISRSSPVQIGALTTWASAVSGAYSVYAIKTDGTLWSWGDNTSGALGNNNASVLEHSSPIQVGSLTTWLKVAAGPYYCFAIKTDGTLWGWGRASSGQLGDNQGNAVSSPKQVGSSTNWASVGTRHASSMVLAITTSGQLYAWGNNGSGQLGNNTIISVSSPIQIGALTNWSKATANGFSFALKTDGTMWSWGAGGQGMTGHGDAIDRSSPKQIGSLSTWAKISAGNPNGFAIKTNGTLWSWGGNSSANLGHNDTIYRSSPKQVGALTSWLVVSASDIHTACINNY